MISWMCSRIKKIGCGKEMIGSMLGGVMLIIFIIVTPNGIIGGLHSFEFGWLWHFVGCNTQCEHVLMYIIYLAQSIILFHYFIIVNMYLFGFDIAHYYILSNVCLHAIFEELSNFSMAKK